MVGSSLLTSVTSVASCSIAFASFVTCCYLLPACPLEHTKIIHPVLHPHVPSAEGNAIAGVDGFAVTAMRIDVQLDRHADLEQGVVELDRLHRVRSVVFASAGQECRRCVFGSRDVHRPRPARINESDKIGPAALLLDRVA